jgi:hypothetical protein
VPQLRQVGSAVQIISNEEKVVAVFGGSPHEHPEVPAPTETPTLSLPWDSSVDHLELLLPGGTVFAAVYPAKPKRPEARQVVSPAREARLTALGANHSATTASLRATAAHVSLRAQRAALVCRRVLSSSLRGHASSGVRAGSCAALLTETRFPSSRRWPGCCTTRPILPCPCHAVPDTPSFRWRSSTAPPPWTD